MLHLTAVQVRRDIMLMGYSGQLRKGYDTNHLVHSISETIDHTPGKRVAVVGAGKLGRAIVGYFAGRHPKLTLAACFDIDPLVINTKISGIHCHPLSALAQIITQQQIDLAILTVPHHTAQTLTTQLVSAGIKGILNYTSATLDVPENVFLEQYDRPPHLKN
jgi:redox-sensing transcriptional repressor